jgi:O-methyltransferase
MDWDARMNVKHTLKKAALYFGYDIRRIGTASNPKDIPKHIPNAALYQPLFSPWLGKQFTCYYAIAAPRTLVSADRCYVLYTLLKQALTVKGDVWECGVYQGGTAAMLAKVISESGTDKKLFLFDTFAGMPATDKDRDLHQEGDFSDTSVEQVEAFVNAPDVAVLRRGYIPDTFSGLESHCIAFAHIDVDIYRSVIDSIKFIWPRLSPGGFVVFDDYGFPSCPGALRAVDEFFAQTPAHPLCLHTGQALVFKP